jgi:AraC-like DNA-binding protein
MFDMKVHHRKTNFKVVMTMDHQKAKEHPFTGRHMADYLMVFVVHELNGLLMEKIQPVSARFPYPITDPSEYARVFQCPVTPKATELSLEFPAHILKQEILSANYELQNFLLQKINILTKAREEHTLRTRIYNYLLANSYLHALSLEAVAANFNLSARSLQRKLKEEGVSYSDIVEEVRKTLAIHYINSGNYPIKDISHILGYNEQSAFLRAFKRWTGKTPKTFSDSSRR